MNSRGFTLLEVLMTLLLVAILATAAITSLTKSVSTQAFDDTMSRMNTLRAGIIGDPAIQTRGVRTSFGYHGDIGALPTLLSDLIAKPAAVSAYANDTTNRVAAGWNGPYIPTSDAAIDYTKDGWGNAFVWSPAIATPTLVSLGSDGAVGGTGLAQDITMDFPTSVRFATVHGFIVNGSAGTPADVASTDRLYYPNGTGGVATATTTTTVGQAQPGYFTFANIPLGARSALITITAGTIGPVMFAVDRASYTIPTRLTSTGILGGSCPSTLISFDFTTSSNFENVTAPTFAVSADNTCAYAMSVTYTIAAGTATSPADFTATSGTFTIPAGSSTGTITAAVVNDAVNEPNETFTITLSNPLPTGLALGANTVHTYTIVNDDGGACIAGSIVADVSRTFTVPSLCTKLTVRSWGAGGGGGGSSAKAGDGGAAGYAYTNQFAVVAGETYAAVIGGGGRGGQATCTGGGTGTFTGGAGGSLSVGSPGTGAAGGAVGTGAGGGFDGGLGKNGGGGGGSASTAGDNGGGGGGATVVTRNSTAAVILIAGGGGGGGGGASGGGTAGGNGGVGCAQAGNNGGNSRGGGGGGGACTGTNTLNGVGRTVSNSASSGNKGNGGPGGTKCTTTAGQNGRVIYDYAP